MTIPVNVASVSFATDGTTKTFGLTGGSGALYFYLPADLRAAFVAADGTETDLLYNTDFSVSGDGRSGTGSITTVATAALAAGGTLNVWRDTANIQPENYQENDGFPSQTHNNAQDRGRLIDQDAARKAAQSLRVPAYEDSISALPNKAARQNGAAGGILVTNPTTGDVELSTKTRAQLETYLDDAQAVHDDRTAADASAAAAAADLAGVEVYASQLTSITWTRPALGLKTTAQLAALVGPVTGDRWLITDGANATRIAEYVTSAWVYSGLPLTAQELTVKTPQLYLKFLAGAWVVSNKMMWVPDITTFRNLFAAGITVPDGVTVFVKGDCYIRDTRLNGLTSGIPLVPAAWQNPIVIDVAGNVFRERDSGRIRLERFGAIPDGDRSGTGTHIDGAFSDAAAAACRNLPNGTTAFTKIEVAPGNYIHGATLNLGYTGLGLDGLGGFGQAIFISDFRSGHAITLGSDHISIAHVSFWGSTDRQTNGTDGDGIHWERTGGAGGTTMVGLQLERATASYHPQDGLHTLNLEQGRIQASSFSYNGRYGAQQEGIGPSCLFQSVRNAYNKKSGFYVNGASAFGRYISCSSLLDVADGTADYAFKMGGSPQAAFLSDLDIEQNSNPGNNVSGIFLQGSWHRLFPSLFNVMGVTAIQCGAHASQIWHPRIKGYDGTHLTTNGVVLGSVHDCEVHLSTSTITNVGTLFTANSSAKNLITIDGARQDFSYAGANTTGTYTPDHSVGLYQKFTATGNFTVGVPTNRPSGGGAYRWKIAVTNSAGGAWTGAIAAGIASLSAFNNTGAAASKKTVCYFEYDPTLGADVFLGNSIWQ